MDGIGACRKSGYEAAVASSPIHFRTLRISKTRRTAYWDAEFLAKPFIAGVA